MKNDHYHAAHKTYENGSFISEEPMAIHNYRFKERDVEEAEEVMMFMSMGPQMMIKCPLSYIVCPVTEWYPMENIKKLPHDKTYIHFKRDKRWQEYFLHDEKEKKSRVGTLEWYEKNGYDVPDTYKYDLPNMTVVDGLILRWCHGLDKRCSHFITTHEELNETHLCDDGVMSDSWGLVDKTYISWEAESNLDWATKETTLKWLRHQPYCSHCLAHNNSYLFPAWYACKKEDIEHLAELYEKYYPAELQQAMFYMWDDDSVEIRLPKIDFSVSDFEGEINLKTMIAQFDIITSSPYKDNREKTDEPFVVENFMFNLKEESGWLGMLRVLPQNERKV